MARDLAAAADPIVSPSIDHHPFAMMDDEDGGGRRYDWSVAIEQTIPLSGLRSRRRPVTRAEAARDSADVDRITLDVVLEAQRALQYETRAAQAMLNLSLGRAPRGSHRAAPGAAAEIEVMRSMYRPMSMVRAGRAAAGAASYTCT